MMAAKGSVVVGVLAIVAYALVVSEVAIAAQISSFNRTSFPDGFVFGAASSAYQFEGAAKEGGKGPNIWDTFTHEFPGKISNGSTGDVADDFYHRYKEDVKVLKFIGLDGFRMSISWARVLPRGKLSGGVNKEGIAFYNNVINDLLSKGIQPFITIFHWDLPQALEDEYGGFLSPHIVNDFRDFAELCFKEFGDRVKHWITMNEPWSYSYGGYDAGLLAPGRCSAFMAFCPKGNSGTEPYIVTHNLLLSHAAAVKLYKEKYQAYQKGQIGITLVTYWMIPYSNSKADKDAAQRALDFMYGWFIEPLSFGEYPKSMRRLVGKRLPRFTKEQAMLVKGSFDFLGLNYYIANYVLNVPTSNSVNLSYTTDSLSNQTAFRNGVAIGRPTGVPAFFMYPKGLKDLLVYTKEKYNDPVIYITENGMGDNNNVTTEEGIKDPQRVYFYNQHLLSLKNAIAAGVKVKGYFTWAFLDNFEWLSGYTQRFGIVYVDFKDGLKRYPKHSALWFKKFLLK
uniref:Beta-primeverosidase n=4 Tax=Camellia sinensis TaxID=4442 RepID=Q7X9A9_CAMSI|nr:Chain A, Beta-primeverosidase [Camellia sinensis]3WQ4_B Chain B, Beta-primeverosidase [Camellia sinensis]3WQ5_A Chain A, Beta-primeverosidase [Camellia sinensis]3WQ5_B Chain B, Beta-primeverosidase [Camellia sinensis]3WQ6_A Chain A, beta-primeverosidase [Camellia sinensis]3WQ6_B Chain B, beta-primeverosidase [Camellia sinensis]BAC78656.1 beta-primeverosidase [Camellia sinensis]